MQNTENQVVASGIPVRCAHLALADVATLVPNPRNPNRHPEKQVALLAKVIRHQGWRSPIVVSNRSGFVVKGHGRLEAAKLLQVEQVPIDRQDYATEADEWADLIADNRLAELSETDDAALKALLDEVEKGGVELELAGMDAEGLEDIGFGEPETDTDAEPQIDNAAELNKVWQVKPGDLWLLGDHRLLCGDSTKAEDIAALLNGQNPALVLADPPYFGKVDADWDNDFDGYDGFLAFLDGVFGLWIPKMIDRGTSGWWCAPDFAWHIEERLRKHAAVFNHIVWSKGKSLGTTQCVEEMRRWRPRSERLLLCEKQHLPDTLLASFNAKTAHIAARSAYASIIDRMVAWQKQAGLTGREIDKCLGTNGMAGHYFGRSQWMLPTQEAWDKMRPLFKSRGVDIGEFDAQRQEFDAQRQEFDAQRREFDAQRREFDAETSDNLTDVWEMSAPHGEDRHGHPTPKPVALISKLVSAHSRTDDLVADPFLGSGTTLIAAEQLGRKCYGMEISPAYCAVILQRMKDAFPELEIARL